MNSNKDILQVWDSIVSSNANTSYTIEVTNSTNNTKVGGKKQITKKGGTLWQKLKKSITRKKKPNGDIEIETGAEKMVISQPPPEQPQPQQPQPQQPKVDLPEAVLKIILEKSQNNPNNAKNMAQIKTLAQVSTFFRDLSKGYIKQYNKSLFVAHMVQFINTLIYEIYDNDVSFNVIFATDEGKWANILVRISSKKNDKVLSYSLDERRQENDENNDFNAYSGNTEFEAMEYVVLVSFGDKTADFSEFVLDEQKRTYWRKERLEFAEEVAVHIANLMGNPKRCKIENLQTSLSTDRLIGYTELTHIPLNVSKMPPNNATLITHEYQTFKELVEHYRQNSENMDKLKHENYTLFRATFDKQWNELYYIEKEIMKLLPKIKKYKEKYALEPPTTGGKSRKKYKNRSYVVHTGSRGGKYIKVNGKKMYV
jgi:hypothetical protein